MSIENMTAEDWNLLKDILEQEESRAQSRELIEGFYFSEGDLTIFNNLKEPAKSALKSSLYLIAVKTTFEVPFEDLPKHLNTGNFVNRATCRFRLSRGM